MYVCMYVCNNIYVRAAAYSRDCHGGAIVNRKLYRTFQSSIEHRTESVRSMDITVSGKEFHRAGPEYEKLRCP